MDSIWNHALGPQGLTASVLHTFDGMLRDPSHDCTTSDISLQAGMGRFYEIRIYIGYVLVFVSYLVVVFNLFFGCRPFHRNWQINPDPGGLCCLEVARLPLLLTKSDQMSVNPQSPDKWSGSTLLSTSSPTCTSSRSRFLCSGSQASGQ
jgi:hypothetical protein